MKQKYKLILALAAAGVSLLFIVMAGQIFPNLYLGVPDAEGNIDSFRQELIDLNYTLPLGLATVAIPWAIAVIFYYVINSVHFDRWWHWGIVLLITALLTSYADWQYLYPRFESRDLMEYYSSALLSLSAWNAVLAAAIFTIASYGIRWWSSNCRHTPIPQ